MSILNSRNTHETDFSDATQKQYIKQWHTSRSLRTGRPSQKIRMSNKLGHSKRNMLDESIDDSDSDDLIMSGEDIGESQNF